MENTLIRVRPVSGTPRCNRWSARGWKLIAEPSLGAHGLPGWWQSIGSGGDHDSLRYEQPRGTQAAFDSVLRAALRGYFQHTCESGTQAGSNVRYHTGLAGLDLDTHEFTAPPGQQINPSTGPP